MQTPQTQSRHEKKRLKLRLKAIPELVWIWILFAGTILAMPFGFAARWLGLRREHKLRLLMKSRGRLMIWRQFLDAMHERGGTCIEERFSPKGPVRFWWTPENVYRESPYEIIDWFTMRKGRRAEPFIRWCRERYTNAESGSAVLVETWGVTKKEIYALWSKCRSEASTARWVEVAPPEIVPRRPGQ